MQLKLNVKFSNIIYSKYNMINNFVIAAIKPQMSVIDQSHELFNKIDVQTVFLLLM